MLLQGRHGEISGRQFDLHGQIGFGGFGGDLYQVTVILPASATFFQLNHQLGERLIGLVKELDARDRIMAG